MHAKKVRPVKLVPQFVGQRFFTVPKVSKTLDEVTLQTRLIQPEVIIEKKDSADVMRYAAYIRISSDEQVGNFSIDAQRRAVETWVRDHGGKLVKLYVDEAESGRSAERTEFLNMRRDAKKHKFDAIIVHKFDRFARNRTDALAIKSLLRRDYGIKVFSVTEPSEDSDGAIGALIEGIMECVAEWYSRNLAEETTKGKRERAMQGYHNNQPPYGMDKNEEKVLIPNQDEIPGLQLAFNLYATDEYSDNDIARELSNRGYRTKKGRRFSTDTVREMLQNKTYLGYVKYQKYKEHTDGRRSWGNPVEWVKGRHEAVISQDLFDLCLEIRAGRARGHEFYPKYRTFLLSGVLFCTDCVSEAPENADEQYGKMRAQSNAQGSNHYYRCRARDFGHDVSHSSVRADEIEGQVADVLKTLKPPADWQKRMVEVMGSLLGDKKLDQRLAEIKSIIERMDFRWDQGFITNRDEYLEKRVQLQQELEQLTPIPDDELEEAADVLQNFSAHWDATNGNRETQKELIQLIVARVWVKDERLVAMSLRPNYHITLGLESEKPTEVVVGSSDGTMGEDIIVPGRRRRGSNPRSLP